jgi:hypothetical protein
MGAGQYESYKRPRPRAPETQIEEQLEGGFQETTTEEAEAEGATMVADKEGENGEFEEIGAQSMTQNKIFDP